MNGINIPIYLKVDTEIFNKIKNHLNEEQLDLTKVLIVSGLNQTAKLAEQVYNQLRKSLNVTHLQIEENTIENVTKINEKIILEEYSTVIAIGGGKVLDVCKYAAYTSRIDLVCVPTTLAHDGIASPIAVLKIGEEVRSLGCGVPKSVLIDLDIIRKSPIESRKSGVGDILSNITAIYDWKLSSKATNEEISEFSLMLSEIAYSSIVNHRCRDLDNMDFLYDLSKSIILSGLSMEISGSSRPCSGSEHLFSHALDIYGETKLPHGIQVAVGSVMSSYIQKQNFEEQINFLKEFNIPYSPLSAGISDKVALTAWMNAKSTRKGRYTVLDAIDYDKEYFMNIIQEINKY
ncbi:iron-containing alcohol dehydrogenase family protein [Sporosarcina sp. FSL K6-2383]|uniref:iron-containing alcohol dehydrogenase family protein n=1 Tax=Sporosarcina sp. FSL K6-2383 TaxID=2921556 RepID=UPI00315B3758